MLLRALGDFGKAKITHECSGCSSAIESRVGRVGDESGSAYCESCNWVHTNECGPGVSMIAFLL